MATIPTLWKLHSASPETLHNAGAFAAALRQHLQHTPAGVTSLLVQIGAEQSAYVIQAGCSGCLVDRCVPGCRVDLLRRVLAVGYAESGLTLVRHGLIPRPYTRAVVAWPAGGRAQPLDASVLQGWAQARLALHWRAVGRPTPRLRASVALCVGEGADDPLDRLRAIGWHGVAAPGLLPWVGRHPRRAPRWAERAWPHDPQLVTPVVAAMHWLMTPPTRTATAPEAEMAVGYANAAAIAQHLQEAGARVELLDLDATGWTARVAATTTSGGDPGPIWTALAAPGSPLEIGDAATGTLALDPSQARPSGAAPPLLLLGTRRDGSQRWRPLSATHHLALAGAGEGGVLLGMLAPAVASRPDLRVGVLDLTATGALAVDLLDLPGRLPLTDGRDRHALLGAIGRLPDPEQPVVVVVAADDAAAAETALVPLLRAALYRPVSLVLVVPDHAAIPALLQARCPVIDIRQRVAHWQVPEGTWEWAHPTALRLPWRDPALSWPPVRRPGGRPAPVLPSLDGFWAVPGDLEPDLAPAPRSTTRLGGAAAPVPPAPPVAVPAGAPAPEESAAAVAPPDRAARPPRHSRVYPLPARPGPIDASGRVAVGQEGRGSSEPQAAAALPPPPAVLESPSMPEAAPALAMRRATVPLPPRSPAPLQQAPEQQPYTPREDRDGHLVVDAPLLALTLQWAEGIDPENAGVSITRFKSGVGLPSKAHSFQLRDALRIHGLIRRELKKEGWYRLLTVEEAVRAGKLPPGPWYVPAVEEGLSEPAAGGPPIAVPAPVDATPGVPAPARRGAVVTADAVEVPA